MKEKIELNSNAVMLRRRLGEDASSPIDIFSVVNAFGNITMVFYPLSDRISGMCVRIGNADRLIAVNSNLSYGRQRYTVAHELYHLFFQRNFKNVICGKDIEGVKDVEEKNADMFASFFLAPYDALRAFVEELKKGDHEFVISDVVRIEQYFGMSRQATLYRLINDGYIHKDFAAALKVNVIHSAMILGYDNRLYIPSPPDKQFLTIGSYIELAEGLKEKGIISDGKYEEYLLEAYRSDIVYNLSSEIEEKYD